MPQLTLQAPIVFQSPQYLGIPVPVQGRDCVSLPAHVPEQPTHVRVCVAELEPQVTLHVLKGPHSVHAFGAPAEHDEF